MAQKLRIAVFDCGNSHTGMVVAYLVLGDHVSFNILLMDLLVKEGKKNMKNALKEYCVEHIDPLLNGNEDDFKPAVIYENIFNPRRGYPNWALNNIQKELRNHYESKGIFVRTLVSSQKWCLGGYAKKDRKEKSIQFGYKLLEMLDNGSTWVAKLDSFDRKHDITDALLAARYVMDKPEVVNTGKKRKRKEKPPKPKKNKNPPVGPPEYIDLVDDSDDSDDSDDNDDA